MYQRQSPSTSSLWLFEHVFGDDEGYMVVFTGRQARLDDPDARQNELIRTKQRSFPYPAACKAAMNYLLREAERGRDCYFGCHLFREAGNRRASNVGGAMRCLWLDEDEGHYPEDGPDPTAIVHSSATRRHLYWQLTRPLSAEWIVAMNRRLAAWGGGDIGKAGLATVLRVPGTYNCKRCPQVDPVRLEVTGVPPWEPEVLDQAIPPLAMRGDKRSAAPYDGPEVDLMEYLPNVEVLGEAPDEAGTKFAIVCPWVAEHSGGDRTGTFIGQRFGGGLWFYCYHEHCQDRAWSQFRQVVNRRARLRHRAAEENYYVKEGI